MNFDLDAILAPLEVSVLGPQGPEFVYLLKDVVTTELQSPSVDSIGDAVMYLKAIRLYQHNKWLAPVWIGISVIGLVTLGHWLAVRR